ncbi:MAG: NAD-dependent deacetylase [Spirochaetaceae bacterium]|jgi:NAD-dependent deacetylase|nr:NAD-dependent deacetylase [Spirochaetaceae bacterium]
MVIRKPGMKELFTLIRSARHCTVLTGAGVSTLSGIPDFRGALPEELTGKFASGVVELYLSGLEDLPPKTAGDPAPFFLFPEKVFDSRRFEEDPAFFYRVAGPLVYSLDTKEPSVVHRVLAAAERQGMVKSVITQNIDMLHRKAGTKRLIELHGSPGIHYCLRCPGIRLSYAGAAAALRAGDMPRCPRCNRILKPAITFYGDPLPLEARRAAEAEAQDADLMLVLGTSLEVFPAADLPRTVLRRGGRIVIVNRRRTFLDGYARIRLWDLEQTFTGLENYVKDPGHAP